MLCRTGTKTLIEHNNFVSHTINMVQTNAKSRKKALAHLKRAQHLLGFGTFIDLTSDSDEDAQVVPGSDNKPNIVPSKDSKDDRSQSASHTSNQSSNDKNYRMTPSDDEQKEYWMTPKQKKEFNLYSKNHPSEKASDDKQKEYWMRNKQSRKWHHLFAKQSKLPESFFKNHPSEASDDEKKEYLMKDKESKKLHQKFTRKSNVPAGLIGKKYLDLIHQQDVEKTEADNAFHERVAKLQQERQQDGWKPADTGPKSVGDKLAHSYMQNEGDPPSALKMIKPIPKHPWHPYQRHHSTGS